MSRDHYLYLTTYSSTGRPGTVPVWFMRARDDLHYFTTGRDSLKARRIRANGRVTLRIGAKDAAPRQGRAEWVDERPDLEAAVLDHYRRKYWILVPLWMGRRISKGLAQKTSVLIRVTLDRSSEGASTAPSEPAQEPTAPAKPASDTFLDRSVGAETALHDAGLPCQWPRGSQLADGQ